MLHDVVFLLLGFLMIIVGGNLVTDGAVSVAKRFHLAPLLIGVTVVAIGSSTPDFVISFISTLKGKSEMAIGDIIGANVFDILFVIGVMALVRPFRLSRSSWHFGLPMLLLSSFTLFICGSDRLIDGAQTDVINRSDGILMLFFMYYFMMRSIRDAKATQSLEPASAQTPASAGSAPKTSSPSTSASDVAKVNDNASGKGEGRLSMLRRVEKRLVSLRLIREAENVERKIERSPRLSMWQAAVMIAAGLAALTFGGNWLVDGASGIAKRWGMSEAMIGLTIVGVGGAIPDLATSLIAALKGETDIAVGNIVGACIFNVFFIIGICAVVRPLEGGNITPVDYGALILGSLLLVAFGTLSRSHRLSRPEGALLILTYLAYILYLIIHTH